MDNLAIEEIMEWFKRGVLWFIVTFLFFTPELKDEASRHFYTGVVRIPGVCYGSDIKEGFRVIGRLFPTRKGLIRCDFVLAYVKVVLFVFCTGLFFYLLAGWLK